MSNFFSEDFIEKVREENDIFDVVSEYVSLEKKGKYFFGLCPFHSEKTPSFSVTPDMQIFNCFGCNKGGNVIHFIMAIENLDFPEAIKLLAERAGIQIPEGGGRRDDKIHALKKEVEKLNREAARLFHRNLMSTEGSMALGYLVDRGIKPGTIRKFGLGFSLPQRDFASGYFLSKGYKGEVLEASGLFIKKDKGEYRDRFYNRIMFPILDLRNRVLGFGGRSFDRSMPKYINSPETIIYNKGSVVYGLNFAKNMKDDALIVTEGYFDVISLHQNGFPNGVAALGTALTLNQAKVLKRYSKEVYLCFDSDEAGRNAVLRSLDILDSIGSRVKVITVPDGKDPDDFFKSHKREEFNELIGNARSLVDYKIHLLEESIDTKSPEGQVDFIKGVSKILAGLGSQVEIEIYVKKYAEEYNITQQAFFSEINNSRKADNVRDKRVYRNRTQSVARDRKGDADPIRTGKVNYNELFLIAILCRYDGLFDEIREGFDISSLLEKNRNLMDMFIQRQESGRSIEESEIMSFMDKGDASDFAKILAGQCNFDDPKDAFFDLLDRTRVMKLELRKNEILEDLKGTQDNSDHKRDELINELNELINEINRK